LCAKLADGNGSIYAFHVDSSSNDSGTGFGPISGTSETLSWHPSVIRYPIKKTK
jgi:hypothetical protein